MKGMRWPICMAADDGPRPVYKKNGSFFSWRSKIKFNSLKFVHNWTRWIELHNESHLWLKKVPLRNKWWAGFPVIVSILLIRTSSILELPNFSAKVMRMYNRKALSQSLRTYQLVVIYPFVWSTFNSPWIHKIFVIVFRVCRLCWRSSITSF